MGWGCSSSSSSSESAMKGLLFLSEGISVLFDGTQLSSTVRPLNEALAFKLCFPLTDEEGLEWIPPTSDDVESARERRLNDWFLDCELSGLLNIKLA